MLRYDENNRADDQSCVPHHCPLFVPVIAPSILPQTSRAIVVVYLITRGCQAGMVIA